MFQIALSSRVKNWDSSDQIGDVFVASVTEFLSIKLICFHSVIIINILVSIISAISTKYSRTYANKSLVVTLPMKIWEVLLSTQLAMLLIDDTQAHIHMDSEGGDPVSALGVGGNGLWKK